MFEARGVTRKLARACRVVTDGMREKKLADELRRAAMSVHLNLAEGSGRMGRDRTHLYSVAYASCQEVKAVLELGADFGDAPAENVEPALALADRAAALLWRLQFPTRAGP